MELCSRSFISLPSSACQGACSLEPGAPEQESSPGIHTASDVEAVPVDLVAEDPQLVVAGLLVAADLVGQQELEAGGLLDLHQFDAWIQGQQTHPLALLLEVEGAEIGHHSVRTCVRRQAGPFPRTGAVEIAGSGEEVDLGHE